MTCTVWSWKDGNQLNLVRQWNMLRRANKIIFDRDATSILIAGNKNFNLLFDN